MESHQAFVMKVVVRSLKRSHFAGMWRLWIAPFDMLMMLVIVMKSRDQAHIPKPRLQLQLLRP